MRGKAYTTLMTIALALVLVLGAFSFVSPSPITEVDIRSTPQKNSKYIPRLPIIILSDADFPGIASSGNGTKSNPWIIENWEINGTGYSNCIYIEDTTEFFEVRDCYLHDSDTGIYLYNVQNGNL